MAMVDDWGSRPCLSKHLFATPPQGALDWHPAPKPVLEAAKQARAAAEAHGVDIGTLAFKESVRLSGVAVHLIGMRTPEEVCPSGAAAAVHPGMKPCCIAMS